MKDRLTKLAKYLLTCVGISALLMGVGAIIWYVRRDSPTTFQDTLFWVGAVPIALFTIGFFGNFFGRGDVSFQLSRSTISQSSNQRAVQDESDSKAKLKSDLKWIIGGVSVWLVSYFM